MAGLQKKTGTDKSYSRYSEFSFEENWNFFIRKASQHFKNFVIDDDNIEVYKMLVAYFAGCEKECEEYELDIDKGIFLIGGVGCGKTSIMEFFSKCKRAPYGVVDVVDTAFAIETHLLFKEENEVAHIMKKYGDNSFVSNGFKQLDYSKPYHYLFDDVGAEKINSHFGQEKDFVSLTFWKRHKFRNTGMLTHATSNLPLETDDPYEVTITSKYGLRFRDRLKEQFNLVVYPYNAKSRR